MQLPEKPIAVGRTAKLYEYKPGWVLKVYEDLPWLTESYPKMEASITRAVNEAGIPAPKTGNVIQINGRWALELERLDGPTLSGHFQSKPWTLFQIGHVMGNLHRTLHTTIVNIELPSQHERLAWKLKAAIGLPEELRQQALAILEHLPTGNAICHGDFHFENIMITPQGPLVIDWVDTTRGHPLGDVARTVMLMGSIPYIDDIHISPMERLAIRITTNIYRRTYHKHYSGDLSLFPAWMAVICAARLSEDIPGQREWLIGQVKHYLQVWQSPKDQHK